MPGNPDDFEDFLKSFREGAVLPMTRRAFLQGSAAAMATAAHSASESAFAAAALPESVPKAVEQSVYLPHYNEDDQILYQLVAPTVGDTTANPFHPPLLPLDNMRLVVTRATDFLHAEFTFKGVSLHYRGGPHLVQTHPKQCAQVTIHLQGQHQQEEAFVENAGSVDPTTPAELTLSGETTFTCSLSLPQHDGLPLTVGNLLAAINNTVPSCNPVSSSIELPYRTIIQSNETSTIYRNSEDLAPKQDAPPQLWHLVLQAQQVTATSVCRSNNTVTLELPSVTGWQQYQTIGILEPATLAGDFVITSVTNNNQIIFTQAGADFSQTAVPLSLANRFLAVRALDFLPTVKGVTTSDRTVTLTFEAPPQVQVDAIIQVQSGSNLVPYVVNAVSGMTLSYQLPPGDSAPSVGCIVSLASTIPFVTDAAGNVVTTQRTTLRANNEFIILNPADSSRITANAVKPDIAVEPTQPGQDETFVTTVRTSPPNAKLPKTGVLLLEKTYPVDANDRHDLVARSSGGGVSMAVDQLVFSALGAWFNTQATFEPQSRIPCPQPPAPGSPAPGTPIPCGVQNSSTNSLEKYIYRMAQGRDYYVETDRTGYLLPFGHEAVLLQITRRVFYSVEETPVASQNICFLRKQSFIFVRQKTRILRTAQNAGHELPFRQVDIKTHITPALHIGKCGEIYSSASGATGLFWPSMTPGNLFSFDLIGYDGTEPRTAIRFSQPLMFVSTDIACDTNYVSDYYNNKALQKRWRQADFAGQTFHFAPSARTGDTELHAGPVAFLVKKLSTAANASPPDAQSTYVYPGEPLVMYRPVLDWAAVDIPSFRVFSGNSAAAIGYSAPAELACTYSKPCTPLPIPFPSGYVKVGYDPLYVQSGFTEANTIEVYLRLDNADITDASPSPSHGALSFPGPQGGGAATPSSPANGLSRSHGITNQKTNSATSTTSGVTTTTYSSDVGFNPATDFAPVNLTGFLQAKLLGCISLADIVGPIADISGSLNQLPNLQLTKLYGLGQDIQTSLQAVQGLLQPLQNAVTTLQGATKTIDDGLAAATSSLYGTIAKYINSLVTHGNVAALAQPAPAAQQPNAAPPLAAGQPVAGGAIRGAQPCTPPLSVFYKSVSDSVQTMLEAIAAEVDAEVKARGIAELASEDYENLRIAGDLNLASNLWPVLYKQYVSTTVAAAVLTLDTASKRLQKDILSNIQYILSREQRPLDQLLKALQDFLALLSNILKLKVDANTISDLRNQAATLTVTFTRTLKQMGVGLNSLTLQNDVYGYYYKNLLPLAKDEASGLRKQLKNSVDDVRKDVKNTVTAHQKAFTAIWNSIKSAHADFKPPATLTSTFDNAIAQGADSAIDCLFDTLYQSADVQKAIGDAQAKFIAGSTLANSVIADLNQYLNEIAQIEDQITGVINLLETPVSISGTYTLADIPLQDGPPGNAIFLAHSNDGKAYLRIDATVSASATPLSPASATFDYSVKAGIYDFTLNLLPSASFITVAFSEFSYTASKSAGTHFTCKLASVNSVLLDEALGFVASLASAFGPLADEGDDDDNSDGGEDSDDGGGGLAPVIHLSGFGLSIGYELTVPPIEAGGFQLVNFGFSIALIISFGNDPLKLQFYFASPDKHFLMSATIFGGGGFLGLELRPDGVDRVQGAMEFGACAGLNLGVASGEVHIFGGIYFDFGDQRCVLTGYVRAGGSMCVIHIITVSLEFYLGLTYEKDADGQTYIYGDCTLTVSISILFFHADVSVDMHWQWKGNKTNPPLQTQSTIQSPSIAAQLMAPATQAKPADPPVVNESIKQWDEFWDKYVAAFR